jgi:DNA mismatch endonuclease (patch repair protein)
MDLSGIDLIESEPIYRSPSTRQMIPLSPEKRSRIMSAIRAHGNMSTELRFISILRTARITGWRRRQALPGRPDFVFRASRVAVFIDGCFWHCCPRCFEAPKQNVSYWRPKLHGNQARDKAVNKRLSDANWCVLRFWEHQLDRPAGVLRRLNRALHDNGSDYSG